MGKVEEVPKAIRAPDPVARNTEAAVCPRAHQQVGEREPWPSACVVLTLPGADRHHLDAPAPHSSTHRAGAGWPSPCPYPGRCVHTDGMRQASGAPCHCPLPSLGLSSVLWLQPQHASTSISGGDRWRAVSKLGRG